MERPEWRTREAVYLAYCVTADAKVIALHAIFSDSRSATSEAEDSRRYLFSLLSSRKGHFPGFVSHKSMKWGRDCLDFVPARLGCPDAWRNWYIRQLGDLVAADVEILGSVSHKWWIGLGLPRGRTREIRQLGVLVTAEAEISTWLGFTGRRTPKLRQLRDSVVADVEILLFTVPYACPQFWKCMSLGAFFWFSNYLQLRSLWRTVTPAVFHRNRDVFAGFWKIENERKDHWEVERV